MSAAAGDSLSCAAALTAVTEGMTYPELLEPVRVSIDKQLKLLRTAKDWTGVDHTLKSLNALLPHVPGQEGIKVKGMIFDALLNRLLAGNKEDDVFSLGTDLESYAQELDTSRADLAAKQLLAQLGDTKKAALLTELSDAIVSLSGVMGDEQRVEAAQALVQRIQAARKPAEFYQLAYCVSSVLDGVDSHLASKLAESVIARLIQRLAATTRDEQVVELVQASLMMSNWLTANDLLVVTDHLVTVLERAESPQVLDSIARGVVHIRKVQARLADQSIQTVLLTPGVVPLHWNASLTHMVMLSESKKVDDSIQSSLDRLTKRVRENKKVKPPTDPGGKPGIRSDDSRRILSVGALCSTLPGTAAPNLPAELADSLMDLFQTTADSDELDALARIAQVLSLQQRQRTATLAELLIEGCQSATPKATVLQELALLFCRMDRQELVNLLKHPACVSRVREAILNEFRRRDERTPTTYWAFVKWLNDTAPDIDLRSPPRRLAGPLPLAGR
jgi:hypothetical protein